MTSKKKDDNYSNLDVGSREWAQAVALGEIQVDDRKEWERNADAIGYMVVDPSIYHEAKRQFGNQAVLANEFLSISRLLTGGAKEYSRLAILESRYVAPILVRNAIIQDGVYRINEYNEIEALFNWELTDNIHPLLTLLDKFADWFNSPDPSYMSKEDSKIECEKLLRPLLYYGWYVRALPDFLE